MKAVFTISSRNYFSYVLNLYQSFTSQSINEKIDFYYILADIDEDCIIETKCKEEGINLIPTYKLTNCNIDEMSMMYNVIEFNTSVKPFVFEFLFNKGYDEIVYLDPDIYLFESLNHIFNNFIERDIILTPHIVSPEKIYTGAVTQEELLFVGMYNCGFIGVKKSEVSKKFVDWWCERLGDKCFADKIDSLHVDQKWIDFVPILFKDNCKIIFDIGYNVAFWNLHERKLTFKDNKYYIESSDSITSLKFFHFSGFNPENKDIIHRRHKHYNINNFPEFKYLFDNYSKRLINNNYEKFSNLKYMYNYFDNGNPITDYQRRLYRVLKYKGYIYSDLRSANGFYYKLLKNKKMLSNSKDIINYKKEKNVNSLINNAFVILKLIKRIFGIDRYIKLMHFFNRFSRLEEQYFLIGKSEFDIQSGFISNWIKVLRNYDKSKKEKINVSN